MTGFDSSAGMLELARRRLGPDADLHLADLASALPFPDGAFDDVIAALVLHYLEDWTGPLAELRRVLRPGGRLIVAVDHPFAIELMHREQGGKPAYFETRSRTEEMDVRRPQRPDDLLDPAAARDGLRVYRGWLPDSRHQRAVARTRRPRTVSRRPCGHELGSFPLLPVLRPGGRLTAASSDGV